MNSSWPRGAALEASVGAVGMATDRDMGRPDSCGSQAWLTAMRPGCPVPLAPRARPPGDRAVWDRTHRAKALVGSDVRPRGPWGPVPHKCQRPDRFLG